MLVGEVHGSGEVKDSQKHRGQKIGQTAAEVLEPRTALIHGWREVTQGRRWIAERWSNTDAILSQGVGHSQGDRPTFCFKSARYAQKTHIPST